jgi:hypothetical protein
MAVERGEIMNIENKYLRINNTWWEVLHVRHSTALLSNVEDETDLKRLTLSELKELCGRNNENVFDCVSRHEYIKVNEPALEQIKYCYERPYSAGQMMHRMEQQIEELLDELKEMEEKLKEGEK